MSKNPTPRRPVAFSLYLTGVLSIAALTFGLSAAQHPSAPVPIVVFGLVALVIFERVPTRLNGGTEMSTGLVVQLPLLLLAGPFWAATTSIAALVLGRIARRRSVEARGAHGAGLAVIGAFAGGIVYGLLGGRFGELVFPEQALALVVTGLVLFAVDSVGMALFEGLSRGPGVRRVWVSGFGVHGLRHLSFVALALTAAVVVGTFGTVGLALVAVPMIVSRLDLARVMGYRNDVKDLVRAFIEPLERVDVYTQRHSHRVAEYSVRLARGLGRSEHEVDEIECAALMHDVGKIGPEQQMILRKPGALSHEELRTMIEHPEVGGRMVDKMPGMHRVAQMVFAHHERPDGKGYPKGLRTDDVPVGARIINVADAFDAMTSDRPYRRALPVEAALRELERGAGSQFDADVVGVLLDLHARGGFTLLPSPSSEDLQQMRRHSRAGGM